MRTLTILCSIALSTVCLHAQTGRFTGTVLDNDRNKGGKPIPGVQLLLQRPSFNWSKTITTDEKGVFQQVLPSQPFTLSITAPGYTELNETILVPIGETLRKHYVLSKQDARPPAEEKSTVIEGAATANEGVALHDKAMEAFKQQDYETAIPLITQSLEKIKTALAEAKDATVKTNIQRLQEKTEKNHAILLALGGLKTGNTAQAEQAEPILQNLLAKDAKDQQVVEALLVVAQTRKNPQDEQKYQDMLEAIVGPNPDVAYDKAVDTFDKGNSAEAKILLQKLLNLKPDYARAFYLLGLVEFNLGNYKAAKEHLQNYVDKDPNGKKVADVKAILADPMLKNLK